MKKKLYSPSFVSRYTLIWVTDMDYKYDAFQNYLRQLALALLIPAHPNSKGRAGILPVLSGISEKEFHEANPEFKPFVRKY